MDTLTHALSGALLARATASPDAPPRSLPRRIAAGFFACAAPDLDFVIGAIGPVEYLLHHRGPTHSILLAPLWAVALAWALSRILRSPHDWKPLWGVCLIGILAHILGDWITSFGTMFLSPLSNHRFGIGATFIIDLWFSGIIVAGLAASAVWRQTRMPAVVASLALVGLVSWQWTLKQEAIEFGQQYAASRGLKEAKVQAYPRPVTAYNWTVFVSDAEAHHFSHVNLRRDAVKEFRPGDGFVAMLDAPYRPLAQARWETRSRFGAGARGREAWESPALGFMRWFAEIPTHDGTDASGNCEWFVDLRFANPGRAWLPFQFGACRDGSGPWRAFERQSETERRPVD